ncbi:MAG TPA: hypothetical protein VGL27_09815, partial [Negativicutes bacterium]
MYKLIIGSVRITVSDDSIGREQAANAARKAIAAATQQKKLLSHIEILAGTEGIEVQTTEKSGARMARKTIKQSMLDGMQTAIQEKLVPTSAFSNTNVWFDNDTGQEWHGSEVNTTRSEILS